MQSLYIIAGLVGLILIGVSVFGVDHGHDGGGHLGHGHDGHGHWIPFLSLRFYTYFFAAFGLCGALLTWVSKTPEPLAVGLASGTGFTAGLIVTYVVHALRRGETSSAASGSDMIGKDALVTAAIRPGSPGRVRLTVKGELLDSLAVSDDGSILEAGTPAIVVGTEGDGVRVIAASQLHTTELPSPQRSQ